jgi:ribonuclease VapC
VIVDTSAIIAILKDEPEGRRFLDLIVAATFARMSAATLLETEIVVDGFKVNMLGRTLHRVLDAVDMIIEPVTREQAERGHRAYTIFGKGSGHPARLNFGDCFSYALAKDLDEPLLFKGEDFIHTDVRIADK